jgi:predicted transposase/invertase (TIGR01784 family)
MFEDSELYTILLQAIFNEKITLLEKPLSQAQNQVDALLNTVRFDTMVLTDKGYYSVDMQRSTGYIRRLENRTVYYACRLIAQQQVTDMIYEKLQPAVVSFVMEKDKNKNSDGVEYISLQREKTGEPFSNLMRIAMVYVPTVLEKHKDNSDLYIFADFFAIETKEQADKFEQDFENTVLGRKLMSSYAMSIRDTEYLKSLEKMDYYQSKNYDEMMKNNIGFVTEQNTIQTAKNFLKMGLTVQQVAQGTGLSIEQVSKLSPA